MTTRSTCWLIGALVAISLVAAVFFLGKRDAPPPAKQLSPPLPAPAVPAEPAWPPPRTPLPDSDIPEIAPSPVEIEDLPPAGIALEGDGGNRLVSYQLALKPTTDYVLTARMRKTPDSGHGGFAIHARRHGATGTVRCGEGGWEVPQDGQWHHVRCKFHTPDDTSGGALYLYNRNGGGMVALDDLHIMAGRTYELDNLAPPAGQAPVIESALVGDGPNAALLLRINGTMVIDTTGEPLHDASLLTVSLRHERVPNGCLLHFDVENRTAEPQLLPAFTVDVPFAANAKIIDAGRVPRLHGGRETHPAHGYPGVCYSPITGVAARGFAVGLALIYPVTEYEQAFSIRTFRHGHVWRNRFLASDPWPEGATNTRGKINPGHLPAGAKRSYTVAVGIAPEERWVEAFSEYRDFFRATYGPIRYQRNPHPVAAFSFGVTALINDDNPQGYSYRLDQVGWQPFVERFLARHHALGWRRLMIWQVAGSYRQHGNCNMVFEIGSGLPPRGQETAGELQRLIEHDVQIGLWMGRATSVSPGFDSGQRWAIDVDNPRDWETWTREVDLARQCGMRMVGLDATKSSHGSKWNPAGWHLHRHFFPKVREAYPDLHLLIEPAASDFLNLWGSSFVWDGHIGGPTTWPEYLIPGVEINAVMKRGRMRDDGAKKAHLDPQRFNQLVAWGYVPLVFNYGDRHVFDLRSGRATTAPPPTE